MNFFSKILILFLISTQTYSFEIKSLYYESCKREIGIILKVDQESVFILNKDGNLKKISRYSVIATANYATQEFPAHDINFNQYVVKQYVIEVKSEDRNTYYTRQGWPISLSKKNILLLDKQGNEILISKKKINKISTVPSMPKYEFGKTLNNYKFLHPTLLSKCPTENNVKNRGEILSIPPQEFTNDIAKIQSIFNQFDSNIKKLQNYQRQQVFYPTPEVYKNQTSISLWGIAGSRHGSGKGRANNGVPVLETQYSADTFDYQHIIYTGSAPNAYTIHEETQTQFYYNFKADYFQMAIFIDPALFLASSNIKWQREDFEINRDKNYEVIFSKIGFDVGHWSFYVIPSFVRTGIRDVNDQFYSVGYNLLKYGVSYRNDLFQTDFLMGSGESDFEYAETIEQDLLRINLNYFYSKKLEFSYSFIKRDINYNNDYQSASITNSSTIRYNYSQKYHLSILGSIEKTKFNSLNKVFPKLGLSAGLFF